jgi:DNA-binding response OmpR family regulator
MKELDATVLIIEDNQLYREFLRTLLSKSLGIKVVEAKDPKVAFEYLKDNIPDLVVLDMELPMMDGFQILKHIRRNPRTKNLAVVPCTVLKQEHLILNLLKLGISDYIDKKLPPKEIAHKIKNVLERVLSDDNANVNDLKKEQIEDIEKSEKKDTNGPITQ